MTRFYVTMTWDDWPEGGSFGTIVEAESHDEAEELCRQEMAETRVDWDYVEDYDDDPDSDESDDDRLARVRAEFKEQMADEWDTVDCFDLDDFIKRHQREPQAA